MKALIVVAALLIATPASAGELFWQSVLIGSKVADGWTTENVIASGRGVEVNPFLQTPTHRIMIEAGTAAVYSTAVHYLWTHKRRGPAIGLAIGIAALNGGMAVHNARIGR